MQPTTPQISQLFHEIVVNMKLASEIFEGQNTEKKDVVLTSLKSIRDSIDEKKIQALANELKPNDLESLYLTYGNFISKVVNALENPTLTSDDNKQIARTLKRNVSIISSAVTTQLAIEQSQKEMKNANIMLQQVNDIVSSYNAPNNKEKVLSAIEKVKGKLLNVADTDNTRKLK